MKRLSKKCILEGYSGLNSAHVIESKTPVIRCPREVLVKVQSSSLNPLDKRMADGYGSNVLESLRIAQSGLVGSGSTSFPLVLGRDVSGTVVDSGGDAKSEFKIGDEVFGATFPSLSGTHQEYVVIDKSFLVHKPSSIKHRTAGCIGYTGLTAWAALKTGGFELDSSSNSRVLVVGGSGGVGSIAVQLALAGRAEVTAVAGPESKFTLEGLGCLYLDYKDENYIKDLISLSGFDIILDCAGFGRKSTELVALLRTGGCVVTLDSPVLNNTDQQGLLQGTFTSIGELINANIKAVSAGNTVRWAYFKPDKQGLNVISDLMDQGRCSPIIEKSFSFEHILDSYEYFSKEKTRGKVAITF